MVFLVLEVMKLHTIGRGILSFSFNIIAIARKVLWRQVMKIGIRISQVLILSLLLLSFAALGIAEDSDIPQENSAVLEKSFYLAAADTVWIRPGLTLTIVDVKIPSDRKLVVTFRITDSSNQPLDRDGIFTPGVVNTSWLLAYIPANASQYVSYPTRVQTSPITGKAERQAAADSGGSYTSLGDGNYRYTFGTVLPANFDTTATHTLGVYARRDLRTWDLSLYVDNEVKNFVPDGSQVTKIREVVVTKSCNACHDPLAAHGETGRRDVEVCILCHTPQTVDPDTGNTTDMKVMTHKIHMGKALPSVIAGKPYVIIGNAQSVNDYSTVGFPADIRNCQMCHKDSKQVNNWLLDPDRETCGSCHDNINWASGENHVGGPQTSDKYCGNCHWPSGDREFDSTIAGAHTVPYKSAQLRNPKIEILSASNFAPGKKPTITFKVTDKTGKFVTLADMTRLTIRIAGPTGDYRWQSSESALKAATAANGVSTFDMTTVTIPADAKGSYAVHMEGYFSATLNPGTANAVAQRDPAQDVVKFFAATGTTVTPRRSLVDTAKCEKCHDRLWFHGGTRNTVENCAACHNPTLTDSRPASKGGQESLDFKIMIHKIHTGEELQNGYDIIGSSGSVAASFGEVRYPGDRRDCLQCHVANSYTLPIASTATQVKWPHNWWDPVYPTSAACLSCHDSIEAAAHALGNTVTFGEACAVCHKESAEFAVSKSHAR